MIKKDFWKHKKLDEMSVEEWEALCGKCGVCCLYKIENEKTGEVEWTNIACNYLDFETGTCEVYNSRQKKMESCIKLTPTNVKNLQYLPETCIYRMLSKGKPLPDWHPLITEDPNSVSLNPDKLDFDTIAKKYI